MESKSILQQAREIMNLSLQNLADEVESTIASLSRIERAQQLPNRNIARRLHSFYGGVIDLGEIYDPTFEQLDEGRIGKLRRLARTLRNAGNAGPQPPV